MIATRILTIERGVRLKVAKPAQPVGKAARTLSHGSLGSRLSAKDGLIKEPIPRGSISAKVVENTVENSVQIGAKLLFSAVSVRHSPNNVQCGSHCWCYLFEFHHIKTISQKRQPLLSFRGAARGCGKFVENALEPDARRVLGGLGKGTVNRLLAARFPSMLFSECASKAPFRPSSVGLQA